MDSFQVLKEFFGKLMPLILILFDLKFEKLRNKVNLKFQLNKLNKINKINPYLDFHQTNIV